MPFYAHITQAGTGCDYSIACGEKFIAIYGAKTLEEAKAKILDTEDGYGSRYRLEPGSEGTIGSITIYECSAPVEVDLEAARAELKRQDDEEAARKVEEKERVDFARLQAKYGRA